MRDRLIEILKKFCTDGCKISHQCGYCDFGDLTVCPSAVAEHILANGVIVPPCNVGDIVYMVTPGGRIHEKEVLGSASVVGTNLRDEIWMKHSFTCESALVFNEDDIGKTVFLTREEAEQAMKGDHHAEIH